VDLDSTKFNDLASLGKALCKNKTLEILHLGSNGITCNNLFNFLEELKKGKFEVKYLSLSNNSLHVANKEKYLDTIGQLIDLGKNLTHVDLSSCQLSKEHMEAIGEALKPSHKLQL
jgi:Ran GTPase-activating protein (RanGAP) involved in mRNA processing and transport